MRARALTHARAHAGHARARDTYIASISIIIEIYTNSNIIIILKRNIYIYMDPEFARARERGPQSARVRSSYITI